MKTRSFIAVLFAVALAAPAWTQDGKGWNADQAREQAERAREQVERVKEQAERAKESTMRIKEQADRMREREDELYWRGADLLNESRWEQAVAAFDKVAKGSGQRIDGAIYWKAYAMGKLGQGDAAEKELEALKKSYPSSRWLNDAKALEVEIKQNAGKPVSQTDTADEELKLLAINNLMHSDPDGAVPILEKFLQSNNTPKLKDRALFVLAQNRSPKALEVLNQVARGKGNPDLQLNALRYLAMFGGKESRQMLSEIYGTTTDAAIKRRILRSYMQAGDKDRLFAAAKSETNAELRSEAIRLLGSFGAKEELWQLYQSEGNADNKKQIIQSLFVAGAVDRLTELARAEKDHDLRLNAIQKLGVMGGSKSRSGVSTGETLVAIYAADKDSDIKREVLKALFVQGDAKSLVDIARKETDPALKKEAVSKLSIMRSKEATDYMMEILSK